MSDEFAYASEDCSTKSDNVFIINYQLIVVKVIALIISFMFGFISQVQQSSPLTMRDSYLFQPHKRWCMVHFNYNNCLWRIINIAGQTQFNLDDVLIKEKA